MAAISNSFIPHVNGCAQKPPLIDGYNINLKPSRPTFKPNLLKQIRELPMKVDISQVIKGATDKILDAFVDSTFKIDTQPLLPSQSNFAPIEDILQSVEVSCTEGSIPSDFPQGVYIRNGPNPLFGGLKSTTSIFGKSSNTWVEGDGMLHALYFKKNASTGNQWTLYYSNRFVESQTFKLETQKNKPCFLPTLEGDSPAIIAAYVLNMLRFGIVNKYVRNTCVFGHAGKVYAIAENDVAQEIDIRTLDGLQDWDFNGAWGRPFTSHPKTAPGTKELVIMGIDAKAPYYVLGVISVDGEKLLHKVDLKFKRCVLIHEVGVTNKYNVIMDYPLTIDTKRLVKGGPLARYLNDQARIGVMPRYGDADSVKWFDVEPHCTFHLVNCFEEGDEVVVRGCKAKESVIPGPQWGEDKFQWFSKGYKFVDESKPEHGSTRDGYLFHHVHEWRLNMVTGNVKEKRLTGTNFSMDFPFINQDYTGLEHKYGYTQVIDSAASSISGMPKFGGLAKLYFASYKSSQNDIRSNNEPIKVEYHKFGEDIFCTGSAFVPKGGVEEDDGWIITFVHNESINLSQVYVIDAKKFESEPSAVISLPQRVPYGFHGTFVSSHKI